MNYDSECSNKQKSVQMIDRSELRERKKGERVLNWMIRSYLIYRNIQIAYWNDIYHQKK